MSEFSAIIVVNGVGKEKVLERLNEMKCEGVVVVSNDDELHELIENDKLSMKAHKAPSIEDYIRDINNSVEPAIFESPSQNCKKNFKRNRPFF